MNEDEDMSADGIAVSSEVEGNSEEEDNENQEQERFDAVARTLPMRRTNMFLLWI